jgi:putative oxidoreductase
LVPLRIVLGAVFLMHGGQKLLYFGLSGTSDILFKLHIPLPTFFAIVIMILEPLGGLAILLGVFARGACVLLAIEMTVAILVARLHGGFFTPYGYEFEMTLLGACLTIAAIGTGPIALVRPRVSPLGS